MKLLRYILILTATLLLAVWTPWLYAFFFASPQWPPFIMFSEIDSVFVTTKDIDGTRYRLDIDGNRYSEREFDSILPTFFCRQLAMDDRLPDTLLNRPVSLDGITQTNFFTSYDPAEYHASDPRVYQLIDTRTDRMGLTTPKDVLLLRNDSLQFRLAEDFSPLSAKSRAFNSALTDAGLISPMRIVAGDGNPRKERDDGYILLDANNRLYRLRQRNGHPLVNPILGLPTDDPIAAVKLCNSQDTTRLAFVGTDSGAWFLLSGSDHRAMRLDMPPACPYAVPWMCVGNMFCITMRADYDDHFEYTAMSTDSGNRLRLYSLPKEPSLAESLQPYLLPFSLSFESATSAYISPRIEWGSPYVLLTNLLFLLLYFVLPRDRHLHRLFPISLLLLTGLYGFLAFLLLKRF